MTQTAALALTLVAGFALGAGAIEGLHAQAQRKPGYVISEVQVSDPTAFQAYAAKAAETVKTGGGRYIVRGKAEPKEGGAPQETIVVLAFDSLAAAEKWCSEPPYQPLIAERGKAAKARHYIVEGLPQ